MAWRIYCARVCRASFNILFTTVLLLGLCIFITQHWPRLKGFVRLSTGFVLGFSNKPPPKLKHVFVVFLHCTGFFFIFFLFVRVIFFSEWQKYKLKNRVVANWTQKFILLKMSVDFCHNYVPLWFHMNCCREPELSSFDILTQIKFYNYFLNFWFFFNKL